MIPLHPPWRVQPPYGAARLDRASPLVVSPQLCVLLTAITPVDVVTGKIMALNTAASITRTVKTPGVGLAFTGNTTAGLLSSGRPTTAPTKYTLAGVFIWTSGAANNFPQLMGTSTANSGVRLGGASNGTALGLTKGGVVDLSTISLISGAPYFVIASHDQGTGDYYITARRLDTNARVANTQTTTQASLAPNGTFAVGISRTDFSGAWNGSVFMSYIAYSYLPRTLAEQWLGNPWQIFRAPSPRIFVNVPRVPAAAAVPRPYPSWVWRRPQWAWRDDAGL